MFHNYQTNVKKTQLRSRLRKNEWMQEVSKEWMQEGEVTDIGSVEDLVQYQRVTVEGKAVDLEQMKRCLERNRIWLWLTALEVFT